MGDLISQKVIIIIVLMLMMSTFSDLIATTFVPNMEWDLVRMENLVAMGAQVAFQPRHLVDSFRSTTSCRSIFFPLDIYL